MTGGDRQKYNPYFLATRLLQEVGSNWRLLVGALLLTQQAMATPEQLKMQQQMMMEQQRRANMNSFLQNKGQLTHYVNSYFETLSTFQVSYTQRLQSKK